MSAIRSGPVGSSPTAHAASLVAIATRPAPLWLRPAAATGWPPTQRPLETRDH